ncbi:hypothetical protein ACJDT4_16425 [Clostridium neuense]|uniref:Uncharacterized protein n=2 Tax=Clostridium neuense TaxID=1728934 RepID=A0ABW8TJL4_9CLOT
MIKDKFNYNRKRGMDQALVDLDNHIGSNAGDSRVVFSLFKRRSKKTTSCIYCQIFKLLFVTYF